MAYVRSATSETSIFRSGASDAQVDPMQHLYGEVDAGYIWNRTATHQLCDVQKWNQSEHDPGYFWKVLDDGTFMDLLLYVDDAYVTVGPICGAHPDALRKADPWVMSKTRLSWRL